jgi:predicted PurR-regulated permease PerM
MRLRFSGRLRHRPEDRGGRPEDTEQFEIEAAELSGVFAAPGWLRDLGVMAWLLVGVIVLLVGAVWLLSLTETIVVPVITAAIVAAVVSPLVDYLERRRVPRAAGAAIVFGLVLVVGVLLTVMILGGVTSQAGSVTNHLQEATHKMKGWLEDLGVTSGKAQRAQNDASSSVSDAFHALTDGLKTGINALASVAVFVTFTALSLFFLLKDGPRIRDWAERHAGVPVPVARTIFGRTASALRGYFAGVTIVAAFNGIVIGLGALVLGVPLAGTIAIVNFAGAYIPYLGAWTAGAFAVLIALGAKGSGTALAMAVIALLANGALQQLIQPIAYGATLGIHPLAVLIVTIAAGSLFGTIGLVLAAPLTSAAVRISADLSRARAHEERRPTASAEPQGTGHEAGPAAAPG